MPDHALIFSHDELLCEELRQFLQEELHLECHVAQNEGDLPSELTAQRAVFLDLRHPEAEGLAPRVLRDLEHANGHHPCVFSISERGFRREWADLAARVVTTRLEIPVEWRKIRAFLRNGHATNGKNGASGAAGNGTVRVVQSNALRFSTRTPALFPVLDQLERLSAHDVTLLLIGETGTGKTTLAQLLHQLSLRAEGPFMTVACGALPPDLIESELFGHVRGAFTGADRAKIGRFEAAARGTLLLDEIDVLSPKEQAKLLRVIETGEFEPVGSTETRVSQARLIVASNVDLKSLTEKNLFRSDLYYRLNMLEFYLPPLRERLGDIVPMALEFVDDCCHQHQVEIDYIEGGFLDALTAYDWPGNIRELKNHVRRAVLFARNRRLTADDLAVKVARRATDRTAEVVEPAPAPLAATLADQVAISEREILEAALRAHDYKRTAAARTLGISRVGLYKKMRKHGMLKSNGTTMNGNGSGAATDADTPHSPSQETAG